MKIRYALSELIFIWYLNIKKSFRHVKSWKEFFYNEWKINEDIGVKCSIYQGSLILIFKLLKKFYLKILFLIIFFVDEKDDAENGIRKAASSLFLSIIIILEYVSLFDWYPFKIIKKIYFTIWQFFYVVLAVELTVTFMKIPWFIVDSILYLKVLTNLRIIFYRVIIEIKINTMPSHNKHTFVRPKKVCLLW